MVMGTLHLTILSARGLRSVALFGKNKPVAVAWVTPLTSYSTKVASQGGRDPVWGETLIIPIEDMKGGEEEEEEEEEREGEDREKKGADSLLLRVQINHRRLWCCDVPIGVASIPLDRAFLSAASPSASSSSQDQQRSYPVRGPFGRKHGLLTVAMRFLKASSPPSSPCSIPIHGDIEHDPPHGRESPFCSPPTFLPPTAAISADKDHQAPLPTVSHPIVIPRAKAKPSQEGDKGKMAVENPLLFPSPPQHEGEIEDTFALSEEDRLPAPKVGKEAILDEAPRVGKKTITQEAPRSELDKGKLSKEEDLGKKRMQEKDMQLPREYQVEDDNKNKGFKPKQVPNQALPLPLPPSGITHQTPITPSHPRPQIPTPPPYPKPFIPQALPYPIPPSTLFKAPTTKAPFSSDSTFPPITTPSITSTLGSPTSSLEPKELAPSDKTLTSPTTPFSPSTLGKQKWKEDQYAHHYDNNNDKNYNDGPNDYEMSNVVDNVVGVYGFNEYGEDDYLDHVLNLPSDVVDYLYPKGPLYDHPSYEPILYPESIYPQHLMAPSNWAEKKEHLEHISHQ